MRNTEMRIAMVKHRVEALRKKYKKRLTARLTMLCVVITGFLARIASTLADWGHIYVPGLYGATMLSEDAGGYVMVAIIAFSVAVVITVLCIRYREKKHKRS